MSVTCLAPNGTSFSNSWWDWRPLAEYCFTVCPALEASAHFRHWSTNDGRVTAEEAHGLAAVLRQEIASGRCLEYLQARRRAIEEAPDVPCEHCQGTGQRHHTPLSVSMNEVFRSYPTSIRVGDAYECNVCGGIGTRRPWADHYPFEVDNVRAFADFLRKCDGFEVM